MAYQPIQDPLPVTGSVTTTQDPAASDAFGRLRVSQLNTQIDIKHTQDEQPLLVDQVTNGAATITRVDADSLMEMATVNSGDYAISQTKQRFAYFSGKSFVMFLTFVGMDSETDVTKRIGYYSSSISSPYTASLDGLYLENDGTGVSVNIAKSGTVNSVAQASWNLDVMDGTGASGVNLDFSKAQIMICDFEWLGVGSVRFGFVSDGKIIYVHRFNNANNVTSVYMRNSNQPLRWEIRQNGATAGSMKYISATVAAEGQMDEIGKVLSTNNGSTHVDANVDGTRYALLGLRLKAADLDTLIELIDTSTLAETADDWLWELYINPTVAGTFTYSGITNSSLEVATGATANTVSGGTLIACGYGAAFNNGGSVSAQLSNALRLGANIDGTLDEMVLTAIPLSSNLNIFGSLTWREIN